MTTTTPTAATSDASPWREAADVLVIFGVAGDLARVMTFRSLYRLEARGLDCPIVGVAVDDWSLERLVQRARDSIVATGEPLDEGLPRGSPAAWPTCRATSATRAPTGGSARRSPVRHTRCSTSRSHRSSSPRWSRAWPMPSRARRPGSWSRSPSVTTSRPPGPWPPTCTSTSTRRSSTGSTTTSERWGTRRSSTCGSPTPSWNPSGTAASSSASRSPWPRTSAWRTAATSTTPSVRSGTWW